jgi:hypothetical protein
MVLTALLTGLNEDMRTLVNPRQPLIQIRASTLGKVVATFHAVHIDSFIGLVPPSRPVAGLARPIERKWVPSAAPQATSDRWWLMGN